MTPYEDFKNLHIGLIIVIMSNIFCLFQDVLGSVLVTHVSTRVHVGKVTIITSVTVPTLPSEDGTVLEVGSSSV